MKFKSCTYQSCDILLLKDWKSALAQLSGVRQCRQYWLYTIEIMWSIYPNIQTGQFDKSYFYSREQFLFFGENCLIIKRVSGGWKGKLGLGGITTCHSMLLLKLFIIKTHPCYHGICLFVGGRRFRSLKK